MLETHGNSLRQALRLLLRFQRKNRYLASAWGALRIAEQQLLLELDTPGAVRPSELSWRLCLPMPNVSHLIASMKRKGYVASYPLSFDKREGRVTLTKKGVSKVRETDRISNFLMHDFVNPFSDEEQRILHRLFADMGDGLGAPPSVCKPGDHPLRIETRRLTRSLGIITRDLAGTGLTNIELQLLYLLQEKGPSAREELAEELGITASALSRGISRLKKLLAVKGEKSRDKRLILKLTEQGQTQIEKIDSLLGAEFLRRCGEEYERFLGANMALLEKALAVWNSDLVNMPAGVRVETHPSYFEGLIAQALIFISTSKDGLLLREQAFRLGSEAVIVYLDSTVGLAISLMQNQAVGFGVNENIGNLALLADAARGALREYLQANAYSELRLSRIAAELPHQLGISSNRQRSIVSAIPFSEI